MSETLLETHALTRSFGALKACDGVSLDVRSGEIHALIGPNGAGKSTLVKLLCGEIRSDSGSVLLMGRSVEAVPATDRAHLGMARSYQISALAPSLSGVEHVMLALLPGAGGVFRFFKPIARDADLNEQAMSLLGEVGLAGRGAIPVAGLSHGERRQLELALALALKPKVLLLDEPMAGMGAEGTERLSSLLGKLRGSMGILLIEHDMDAVFALADRISVMVGGKIVRTGNAEEIRGDALVQEAYLGTAP